jgi:hypothetical protein
MRARARSKNPVGPVTAAWGSFESRRALMFGGDADCMTWRFDDRSPEAVDLRSALRRVVVIRQERRGWE